ncbi:adenylyl-sulfate kinase [Mycetocola sp.]|uniref:adenylyl-sulfate kinase n=1 Tax=Mycetocola sp. TaxID=1871042 RepID=UPI00398A4AE4
MRTLKPSEVVYIGGRAGVGKTTVAAEISHILRDAGVPHAVIEGDNLDQAYPEPWRNGMPLAERNLAAMWHNYHEAGYRRLIYTNTVSVLEMANLNEAIGGEVRATGVLLGAEDKTAALRLAGREIGSDLEAHVERSNRAGERLEQSAPEEVHRVATDARTVTEVARTIIGLTKWTLI